MKENRTFTFMKHYEIGITLFVYQKRLKVTSGRETVKIQNNLNYYRGILFSKLMDF